MEEIITLADARKKIGEHLKTALGVEDFSIDLPNKKRIPFLAIKRFGELT